MPGMRCAVAGCKNSWMSVKAECGELAFHVFPKSKDFVLTTIRKEWVRRCKRAAAWNPDNSRICSAHFSENDYERDLQNELLGLPPKKILKKTAVPTQNFPCPDSSHLVMTKRDEEMERGGKDDAPIDGCEYFSQPSTSKDSQPEYRTTSALSCSPVTSTSLIIYEQRYSELLSEFSNLKENYAKLDESSRRKMKNLSNNLNYYKKKCFKLSKSSNVKASVKHVLNLKGMFKDSQISLIVKSKKRSQLGT